MADGEVSGFKWTDENVARLRSLTAEGRSASEICKAINASSRNAIIGKQHRLKIGPIGTGRATHGNSVKSSPAPAERRTPSPQTAPRIRLEDGTLPPMVVHRNEAPGSATILTIRFGQCRWPIGDPVSDDFTMCGCQAIPRPDGDGVGPYCGPHARIAFQPPRVNRTERELVRSLRRFV